MVITVCKRKVTDSLMLLIILCVTYKRISDGLVDSTVNVGNRSVQSGIPEEAFDLECPDLELKASILQQFILLDGKYVERLNQLEEDHCSVLR